MKKSNSNIWLYIPITFNTFTLNKHFSTTSIYLGAGEDKGKRKATEEDMARWEEEEASNRDIKKTREEDQEDQEEKEMEKAIQESKKSSKKLNTNEEAGPSNYQANIDETQAGPSNNPVATTDHPSYINESDSSSDNESHYRYGVEDQTSHCRKSKIKFIGISPDDPRYVANLEAYIELQKNELESVTKKLSNPDVSKAEHKWDQGRESVIVIELDRSTRAKEIMHARFREEQHRIAHLNDDEGLGKTPSDSSSEFDDSDASDDSDESDDSGSSDNPNNPGTSTGPGNSGSNEPGPTGEEGSNGSYKIIIPLSILNFITEVFEHITNIFFF
jgi:hypothetical protein